MSKNLRNQGINIDLSKYMIQGPPGPTGPGGENGGPTGPTGIMGHTGIQGPTGPVGASGTNGINGVIGATGQRGATGAQRIQGIQGPTSTSGLTLPASSTDNAIVRWDGTLGKSIQNSVCTITDDRILNLNHANSTLQIASVSAFPASSVALTVPKFGSTTGKQLITSGVSIDGSDRMTVPGGLILGTSTALSYYEIGGGTYAFNGPWSTNLLAGLSFVRIGQLVCFRLGATEGNADNGIYATSTAAIQSTFRPSIDMFFPINGVNGTQQSTLLMCIFTTGYIRIGKYRPDAVINNVANFEGLIVGRTGWSQTSVSYVL